MACKSMPHPNQSEAENVDRDQKREPISQLFMIISWALDLGLVAQLVERRLCKAEALGSNPSKSIYNAHIEVNSMWKDGGPFVDESVHEVMYKLCDQTLTEFSGA